MTSYPNFGFEITHRAPTSRARVGRLKTPHGTIDTPNFIFCGTKATVKSVLTKDVKEAGTDIILANTYHLMLQPGADIVERMGGLHKFMNWDGPMLTDSGGYQIFSLGYGSVSDEVKGSGNRFEGKALLSISEEGAAFRSYIDGQKVYLTPEKVMEIQRKLGPDLVVQLDECTPYHAERDYTARAMAMSRRWGERCLTEFMSHNDGKQGVYGTVSGGVYEDLRIESAQSNAERDYFAVAIADCLGETKEHMYEVVAFTMPHVHPERPVHLLGIGGIGDILTQVRQGIDTFDCVTPTRIARHGWALKKGAEKERINLRNAMYRENADPIDEDCDCHTCQNYSTAYLHHLFKAKEFLGMQLVTIHNIHTMNRLMREVRAAILNDTLSALHKEWCPDAKCD
ncbi:MAG: tRNA guanosine(34) transglycosylase Tgt [Pseudomonadota bacterium]